MPSQVTTITALACLWLYAVHAAQTNNTWVYTGEVHVGILHSLTGTMSISEITLVNADLMAIDEINAAGGLLGKKVVPIIADGASDWNVFAKRAGEFTNPNHVNYTKAVFGCWTSASRKAVLPVFEAANHMLLYPVQYEGQECSKNIFYTGATPNQQSEPAVDWLLRKRGDTFFLVGSDYVFPRTSNAITRGQLAALGATVVGEEYITLGDQRNSTVAPIVQKIITQCPNGCVIMNTLNGDSNVKFFHMFYDAGLRADKYPVMSLSITETEISVIGVKYLIDHYAAWNFFQAIKDNYPIPNGFDPAPAQEFVSKYRTLYGQSSLVNDPMEAAYISVHLWAQAVSLAGTFDLEAVRRAMIGQAFSAGEGEVTMQSNHHISKFVRLGQVTPSGDFKMVYESTRPVFPEPWNTYVNFSAGHACDWSDPTKGGFYKLDTVQVALVHSLNGPNAAVEKQHLQAELAAIKILNRNGGALGKTILFTVYDVASNDPYALATIKSLATAQNAPAAIFGRSPSDTAYASLGLGAPLLFSPTKSVGAQCAEKVVHMGGLLNQQLEPALQLFSQRARDAGQKQMIFYLVTPPEMLQSEQQSLRNYIQSMGDVISGSMAVGSAADAAAAVASIQSLMSTGGMVLNLLTNPTTSVALLQAMRNKQMPAGAFPVLLTGVLESDISAFGDLLSNHFASLPYFSVLGSPANKLFLGDIAEWYGYDYIVTDQVQASFAAMVAWAGAVGKAGSFASRPVLKALWTTPLDTAAGQQSLDGSNYGSTIFRLGTLNSRNTGFRVVAEGSDLIKPKPFWLHPELSIAQCDFQLWMRLQCSNGEGLVSSDGTFLDSRQNAIGCKECPSGRPSINLDPSAPFDMPSRICDKASNTIPIVIGVCCGVLGLGLIIGCITVRYFQRKVALLEQFANMKLPENVQEVIEEIHRDIKPDGAGQICKYIPQLATLTPEQTNMFGIVICDLEGNIYKIGDADMPHTIQSTCKVLLFCCALMEKGKREVTKVIGTEPTGRPFDEPSINIEKKQVFNPYVNAGGITSAGLMSGTARERYQKFEDLARLMTAGASRGGHKLRLNELCYTSEMATNTTNQATTRQLVAHGCVQDGGVALDAYTLACSLDITAEQSAIMAATFANKGVNPLTKQATMPEDINQDAVSIMISCGMYNGAGQWIVDVGVPAKSGVGGGVIGVVPGVCGFATFSPRLDENGNSVRGVLVAKAMSEALGLHVLGGGPKGQGGKKTEKAKAVEQGYV
jgi:urea transport system substrate-binding protein